MYTMEKGVLRNSGIYFHTPSTTARTSYFYLNCAGEFFCNGDYRVERETYHSFLIMYIRKGSGFVSFNNRTFNVCENDAVILDCHQRHSYYTNTGWETLWIHFDGNSGRDFFEQIYARSGAVISMGESITVYRYLSMIINGFRDNRPLHEALVSSHIHRMLAEMLMISSSSTDYSSDRNSTVIDAIMYINTNFNRWITVNDLADCVKLSLFHFSRVFKKETGYSPYEYIIKTRIDHAREYLKRTRLTVKEISFAVGFKSESNFVNTFRKCVNLTPNEFRNTPV
jgi:AraC family transcriptional regulator